MRSVATSAAVLLALVMTSYEAKATSIIAVWTPNSTYIAADSKMIHYENFDKNWTICKINAVNNVYWASAGITRDVGVGFSVKQLVDDAMSRDLPLEMKFKTFEEEAKTGLSIEMNGVYKAKPEIFKTNFDHKDVLELVLSGFSNGANYLYFISFAAYFDPISGTVKILLNKETKCPCEDNAAFAFGAHLAIDAELRQTPGLLHSSLESGDELKRLIGLEIARSPKDVGPPISVLEIQNGAPRWIDKGTCTSASVNK